MYIKLFIREGEEMEKERTEMEMEKEKKRDGERESNQSYLQVHDPNAHTALVWARVKAPGSI